jgi:hypothetical protein
MRAGRAGSHGQSVVIDRGFFSQSKPTVRKSTDRSYQLGHTAGLRLAALPLSGGLLLLRFPPLVVFFLVLPLFLNGIKGLLAF